MDRLPVELAHFILEELCPVTTPDEIPIIPLANLKALRLSCRPFAHLAASYLFQCVWLYMDEDSFAKLTALSEHPILRYKVSTIKIFSKLLSADLLVKEDYETCVKSITFSGEGRGQWGFEADGNRILTQADLDTGFVEYIHYLDKESSFQCKAEGLLQAALQGFPKLSWISPGFAKETFEFGTWPSQLSKVADIARKTLMARDCKGWNSVAYDVDAALIIIRAIATSERSLSALYLGAYDCFFLDFSPRDRVFAEACLQSITHLGLRLFSPDATKLEQILDAGCCSRFLKWAPALESLVVATNEGKNQFRLSLHHVFGPERWDNLDSLTLFGFYFESMELIKLVNRHRRTLSQLYLNCCTLVNRSWYHVFTGIRDTRKNDGALKKFLPSNLANSDHENNYFAWGCDPAVLKQLDSFIFEDGAWPSGFPAGLLLEN